MITTKEKIISTGTEFLVDASGKRRFVWPVGTEVIVDHFDPTTATWCLDIPAFRVARMRVYVADRQFATIKDALVKLKYSPEDQIAIMLNKDDSEKDLENYNYMQEWRKIASTIAKTLTNE